MMSRHASPSRRARPLLAAALGLAVGLTSVSSAAALTCIPDRQPPPEWPNTPAIDRIMTRRMYEAAAFVDVAVAIQATPARRLTLKDRWLILRDWRRGWWAFHAEGRHRRAERKRLAEAAAFYAESGLPSNLTGAPEAPPRIIEWGKARPSAIRFRSVERLKGGGPREFELHGLAAPEYFHPGWGHNFDDRGEGYVRPVSHRREGGTIQPSPDDSVYELRGKTLRQYERWGGSGGCGPPGDVLRAYKGVRYLIFRSADGRLLTGPAGRPIAASRPVARNSPWLAAARLTSGAHGERRPDVAKRR